MEDQQAVSFRESLVFLAVISFLSVSLGTLAGALAGYALAGAYKQKPSVITSAITRGIALLRQNKEGLKKAFILSTVFFTAKTLLQIRPSSFEELSILFFAVAITGYLIEEYDFEEEEETPSKLDYYM